MYIAGETMDIEDEISANQAEVLAQFERRKRVSKWNFHIQICSHMTKFNPIFIIDISTEYYFVLENRISVGKSVTDWTSLRVNKPLVWELNFCEEYVSLLWKFNYYLNVVIFLICRRDRYRCQQTILKWELV